MLRADGFLELKAKHFAYGAHTGIGQVRKYTLEPYIIHPFAVAALVMSVAGSTSEMIAAAYLHDVVEDTEVTSVKIHEEFGHIIGVMVDMLTNVPKSMGNRAVRKQMDLERLAAAGPEVQTVKLADLIDNSKDILQHDPSFARVYLEEKKALLEVLTDGDPTLYRLANEYV